MNQGRIWCVVNPTVGLPLFLGSVAVTSLIVHYSVLSHSSWFGAFLEGGKNKKASLEDSVSPVALAAVTVPGHVISIAPLAGESSRPGSSFVFTVAPAPVQAPLSTPGDMSTRPLDKVSLATIVRSDEN